MLFLLATVPISITILLMTLALIRNKKLNYMLIQRDTVIGKQKEDLEKSISNLNEAQSKIIQQDKLAYLGLLTAGLVHDLNNHLNFISGGFEALRSTLTRKTSNFHGELKNNTAHLSELESDILETMNSISNGVERSSKVIQSIKTFSSPHEQEISYTTIEECIEIALSILESKLRSEKIMIIKDYRISSPILGNPPSLSRLFLNLIDNAIDAMMKKEKKVLELTLFDSGDRNISVIIKDTGCGITSTVIPRIFDPFYTTKKIGKGTGLGLSIARTIVIDHGGKIDVQSDFGKGTKFTIVFPPKR